MSVTKKKFPITAANTSKKTPEFCVTKNINGKYFLDISSRYPINMWDRYSDLSREDLLKLVKGQSGILCSLADRIDREVLDVAGPQLKVVSTMSVGYDHIDAMECRNRGIQVGYTPDVLTDAVAELTLGLLIATLRRMFEAGKALRSKSWLPGWEPFFMCGGTITGSVIGFIGAGRIGKRIMELLKPFKPSQILYITRNRVLSIETIEGQCPIIHCQQLSELLTKSDIIVVCCSLNSSTKQLLGEKQFEQMKSSAVVINTSRGAVIDQRALYNALKTRTIAGAGLDVFEEEPLPPYDPLLELDNVVLLPHIGSATVKAREDIIKLAVKNLEAGLEGKPLPAGV